MMVEQGTDLLPWPEPLFCYLIPFPNIHSNIANNTLSPWDPPDSEPYTYSEGLTATLRMFSAPASLYLKHSQEFYVLF